MEIAKKETEPKSWDIPERAMNELLERNKQVALAQEAFNICARAIGITLGVAEGSRVDIDWQGKRFVEMIQKKEPENK